MDVQDAANAAARLRRYAIVCVLAQSALFTFAAGLVKAAAPSVPTIEIMLFRSGVALVCMWPLIRRAGGLVALRTRRPWGHTVRIVAGTGSMFGTFYGYATMPLATVTALGFAMPVFLSLLSVPLLGERLNVYRWVSVGAGLLGVVIVLQPWQAGGDVPMGPAAIVVLSVIAWAVAMVSIRKMGQGGERNVTIVVWFGLAATILSAALCVPVWVTPAPAVLAGLIGVGVISALAQYLMTEGYRKGEATMLAPFEYGAIIYTVLMGWLIWDEVPGRWESVGIAVLVVSGLATWWRETAIRSRQALPPAAPAAPSRPVFSGPTRSLRAPAQRPD